MVAGSDSPDAGRDGRTESTERDRSAAPRWLHLACDGKIVRRALMYALVVGVILIGINHGDALLAGRVDGAALAKMALTVLVPYCVSTLSSIAAIRAQAR